jgi:hypothetical protein
VSIDMAFQPDFPVDLLMHVFVAGASGHTGTAVVPELI